MLKTTATRTTPMGGDRHIIMASIVPPELWRLCLLSVAIPLTRLIISQNAGYHPRPSTTFRVFNWTKRLLGPGQHWSTARPHTAEGPLSGDLVRFIV